MNFVSLISDFGKKPHYFQQSDPPEAVGCRNEKIAVEIVAPGVILIFCTKSSRIPFTLFIP